MAQGDGSAVHVDAGLVETQFLDYRQTLGSKRLVQLNQVDGGRLKFRREFADKTKGKTPARKAN